MKAEDNCEVREVKLVPTIDDLIGRKANWKEGKTLDVNALIREKNALSKIDPIFKCAICLLIV